MPRLLPVLVATVTLAFAAPQSPARIAAKPAPPTTWTRTVHHLDSVMAHLEDLVAHATGAQLAQWAPTLTHISTHNAGSGSPASVLGSMG